MKKLKLFSRVLMLLAATMFMVSCSDDDNNDQFVQLRVNGEVIGVDFDRSDDFNGDIDGDFTGNGGSGTRSFTWLNNLSTADYNADITATSEGEFTMQVFDANQTLVLERSLRGNQDPDSFSGVTASGASGIWTVTITLTSFNGDGSFSLSEGD